MEILQDTYAQKVGAVMGSIRNTLPPEVLEAMETLQPRPTKANQAAENLKKYGLELPDSEIISELFSIAKESVAASDDVSCWSNLPVKVREWYEVVQNIEADRQEALRLKALSKLTPEEREVLGLNQEEDF